MTGSFWGHVAATAAAFCYAFALSAALGLALGLVFGLRRFAGDVAEPILAGFYTIPKITLYPVVLLVFGLGVSAKVAFGVMHGLVPVVLFTLGAIRSMPPILLRTARSLRLSDRGHDAAGHRAGGAAGYRERAAGGVLAEPAGGADRGDVLVAARAGLPAGERAGNAQRADDDGG